MCQELKGRPYVSEVERGAPCVRSDMLYSSTMWPVSNENVHGLMESQLVNRKSFF